MENPFRFLIFGKLEMSMLRLAFCGLLCLCLTWVYMQQRNIRSKASNTSKMSNETQNVWLERTSGSDFRRPVPDPYPNWSIKTTKPLPYRAFRYGPNYQVTMGLRETSFTEWIELDNEYPKYHAEKAARIKERGEKCVRTHPNVLPAALELLEELADYLPARYPTLFKRTLVGIDNIWSGETFNIVERPLAEDPMAICARLVQDDFVLLFEQEDGQYRLLAGCVLLPGFWRFCDKFGMTLSNMHITGGVAHFKEKLEKGMLKLFKRIRPETFYTRNNYFIQVDDSLGWSTSIGHEDDPDACWDRAEKNNAINQHYLRSERHSLRRLPKTGAICFTIHPYLLPVTEMAKEDYVPGRLASAIRSWGDEVAKYRGRDKYGRVLLEYLDGEHKKQIQAGLDVEAENGRYPW